MIKLTSQRTCFLCNEPAGSTTLHRACTHDIDVRVVAIEVKYHTKCLANLYNRARVAMIKYSMTLVQSTVQYLNPGQVLVLAADQPYMP